MSKKVTLDSSFGDFFQACVLGKREGAESNLMFQLFDLTRIALQNAEEDRIRSCKDEIGNTMRGVVQDRLLTFDSKPDSLFEWIDSTAYQLVWRLKKFAEIAFNERQVEPFVYRASNIVYDYFHVPMSEWVKYHTGDERELYVS